MEMIKNILIDSLLKEAGIEPGKLMGIGIALPAAYNKKDNIIFAGPLINKDKEYSISEDLEKLAEKYDAIVMVENDTNAQVIGEFQSGGYKEKDDLLFVSLGTGLGAGLILGGKLRRGNNYMCGEIGSTIFELDYQCENNSVGWLESIIGYRRLEADFGVKVLQTEKEIMHEFPKELCQRLAKYIGLCINNINVCLDCKNIVLGGKIVEIIGQPLLDGVNEYLQKINITSSVARREISEDVGLIGMGWLVINRKVKEILLSESE